MLALDFALFIRNSSTKLGLSLSAIAVGNTLAFRIGSNTCSWVSQETLSIELGISERQLITHCTNLVKAGLIVVKKSTKDKRKNIYSFNSAIADYHSMNDCQKKKCHEKLVDKFIDIGRKLHANLEDTGRKLHVNTGRKLHASNEKTEEIHIKNQEVTELFTAPKVKALKAIKSKEPVAPRQNRALITDKFYPNQENQKLCDKVANTCGTTGARLIKKFIDVQKKYKTQSEDFNRNFKEFLEREMPPKRMSENSGTKKAASYGFVI